MSRKHLQEIYDEEDESETNEDSDMTNALNKRIKQLKEKWGTEWAEHIGEGDDSGEEPQETIGASEMIKRSGRSPRVATKGKTNPHRGSTLDEFLDEEGILEEATAKAAKKAMTLERGMVKWHL